jgi:hypothetical protein
MGPPTAEVTLLNLWFRLILLLLMTPWRPKLEGPLDVSRLRFTVLPNDLDASLHMNNGRYWTLMDLGRMDLLLRTGLWRARSGFVASFGRSAASRWNRACWPGARRAS